MKNLIVFLILSTLSYTSIAYTSVQELKLPIDGVEKFVANIGDQDVVIKNGDSDYIQVMVTINFEGWDRNDAEIFLDKALEFNLVKQTNRAVLNARIEYNGLDIISGIRQVVKSTLHKSMKYPRPLLEITVPEDLALFINDEARSIEISGINADIHINHADGRLKLNEITGNVNVIVGTGNTIINEVTGGLYVNQGGGSLSISNITGNADINDGSGELSIYNVKGELVINDSKGDINVTDIGKNLAVYTDGRGRISAVNIRGETYMRLKRAGPVSLTNMLGTTRITDSYSGKVTVITAGQDTILERNNRILANVWNMIN